MRTNTAAQQTARHRSDVDERAVHAAAVVTGIAQQHAIIAQHKRMTQLNTLCGRAGIPWYVRMGASADELEALLMDAAAFQDAEAAAVADDRADMRADLYQF